jgi:thiol-disulfide isomerase/thioredoxin
MTTSAQPQKSTLLKVVIPIVVILTLVLGSLFFIRNELNKGNSGSVRLKREENQILPDISLTQLDGSQTHLSDIKSKVILMNFWASWCEACLEEMPSIVKLRETYHSKGFEVIGINLDETPETMVPKMTQQFQIQFPIFQDPEGKLGELLDVHAIPLTVVFNQQRKILYVKDGEFNWYSESFRAQVENWLKE